MYPYPPLSAGPYPNSALSAGALAVIALVAVLVLATWLILVFAAARPPRHHGAGTTSLPRQPQATEQERARPEHKVA